MTSAAKGLLVMPLESPSISYQLGQNVHIVLTPYSLYWVVFRFYTVLFPQTKSREDKELVKRKT